MRGLADFLGISYEESLVSPYAGGRMIDGPGDPDIFQHDAIDSSLADAWRSVEPPGVLSDETLELAQRLGYQVPGTDRTSLGSPTGPVEADDLLARLDELSDDEVSAALKALSDEDQAER